MVKYEPSGGKLKISAPQSIPKDALVLFSPVMTDAATRDTLSSVAVAIAIDFIVTVSMILSVRVLREEKAVPRANDFASTAKK